MKVTLAAPRLNYGMQQCRDTVESAYDRLEKEGLAHRYINVLSHPHAAARNELIKLFLRNPSDTWRLWIAITISIRILCWHFISACKGTRKSAF